MLRSFPHSTALANPRHVPPTRTNSPRPPSGADGNTNGVLHPTDSPHSTPPDANAAATASLSPRSVHTSACFATPAAHTHRRSQRGPRRPQTRPTRRRRQCEGACSWDKLARLAQRRERPRSRGTRTRPTRTACERGNPPQLPMSPDSLGCSARVAPSDHNLARLARHVVRCTLQWHSEPRWRVDPCRCRYRVTRSCRSNPNPNLNP